MKIGGVSVKYKIYEKSMKYSEIPVKYSEIPVSLGEIQYICGSGFIDVVYGPLWTE